MPNPKVGTVTPNVAEAVKNAKAGQVQYRTDKAGIVHATIGRASFEAADLRANLTALVDALQKSQAGYFQGCLPEESGCFQHHGRGRSRRHRYAGWLKELWAWPDFRPGMSKTAGAAQAA